MILNRDHRRLGMKRTVAAFDQDIIAKFQRMIDGKQDFLRRAVLDHGLLQQNAVAFVSGPTAISVAMNAAELDGNPHRAGLGKEFGQAADNVRFESASSCLVRHSRTSIRGSWSSRVSPLAGWKELRGDSLCFLAIYLCTSPAKNLKVMPLRASERKDKELTASRGSQRRSFPRDWRKVVSG